jgi:hypothetical protein
MSNCTNCKYGKYTNGQVKGYTSCWNRIIWTGTLRKNDYYCKYYEKTN